MTTGEAMNLYKWLNQDGTSANGGRGTWPLPNGQPGEWLQVKGKLIPCKNGLHLCRPNDLMHWIGPALYRAEYNGEIVECDDKVVVRRARLTSRVDAWNDRTARLFACRCVRATPLTDGRTVWDLLTDERSRQAVNVAELFAMCQNSNDELVAAWNAAMDAAWAVTWSGDKAAAWNAAWAAAGAAGVARAARAAAGAAARAAQTQFLCEMLGLD